MALDDPVVWVLVLAVVVLIFGAGKIPQLARALGEARREFSSAQKAITDPASSVATAETPAASPAASTDDPLIVAAQKEGIDTRGKTREQIASELAWKLKR